MGGRRPSSPTRPPDPRGRKTTRIRTWTRSLNSVPLWTVGALSTERSDNTVLHILDPVAITDEHLFRWGDPPHVYKIKAVDGLLQDEATGTRYASEVVLIR